MIDLQIASTSKHLPSQEQVDTWVKLATKMDNTNALVTVRMVDDKESQTLNGLYRGQDKPTNVLSFEADLAGIPDDAKHEFQNYLGDLVLNAALIEREAQAQNKALNDHWAHLIIHGCLHLQGYDHIEASEAQIMESLEVALLKKLGIANPYG